MLSELELRRAVLATIQDSRSAGISKAPHTGLGFGNVLELKIEDKKTFPERTDFSVTLRLGS